MPKAGHDAALAWDMRGAKPEHVRRAGSLLIGRSAVLSRLLGSGASSVEKKRYGKGYRRKRTDHVIPPISTQCDKLCYRTLILRRCAADFGAR